MTVRLIDPEQTKEIVRLQKLAFSRESDVWNENMLLSAFKNGNFFVLGAVEEEKTAACVMYSVAADTADIEIVATSPEFRRKGVATGLIMEAERRLAKMGVGKIFLETGIGNAPAIALYAKCGYERISVRKKYYKDGEDAVVMAKTLNLSRRQSSPD